MAKVISFPTAQPVRSLEQFGVRSLEQSERRTPNTELGNFPLVGREREMTELRASLGDACAGRGRLVLLVGEPGIGKTRTAQELSAYARAHHVHVAVGRCYESEGAPPFWPWVQIVRTCIATRTPEGLKTTMGAGAADIAAVIPEVRECLPDLPTPPELEPQQARFRFFDSCTTFLKNAATEQPLLLILDDLHWADKPSLLLLQFMARQLEHTPVLIVGTYRDAERGHQHPLAQTLGELARERTTHTIPLHSLTERDVAQFIHLITDQSPTETLVASVYQKTEGNPFFVTEVVRSLVAGQWPVASYQLPVGEQDSGDPRSAILDSGTPGHSATLGLPNPQLVGLPLRVREAIGRRLHALSADCHALLTLAAVIGREFSLRVVGVSLRPTPADGRILEILDEAINARLIAAVPHSAGRYAFSHALVRETLYESLSTAQRVRLHHQVGERLEELHRANLEPVWTELAAHFFQAAPGGDADKAITYAVKAGERAMQLLAYEEAVSHYERALQALELRQPDEELRCELLLALGEAQRRACTIPLARDTFHQAAGIARMLKTPGKPQSAASFLARAALGCGELELTPVAANKQLLILLEEALDALGKEDSALSARVLSRLAMELYYTGEEKRVVLSTQAVEMARRVGDTATLAAVLSARRYAIWAPENLEERLTTISEMVRLAKEVGDLKLALLGQNWYVVDLLEKGDLLAVDLAITAHAQLAEELRQPLHQWYGGVFRAMRALLDGRLEEGEHLAQEALAIGQRIQSQVPLHVFSVQLFLLRREQGRLQELEKAVKSLIENAPTLPVWRCGLAYLYSEPNRVAEARREFALLAANDFADLPRDVNWLIAMALLAETCTFLDDKHSALILYKLLLPYAERNVVVGAAIACFGSVSYYLGLLTTTLCHWQDAQTHFTAAIQRHEQMGARSLMARTQFAYARMLLARNQGGDHTKAREMLDLALATAQELRMKSLEEKIKLSVVSCQLPVQKTECSLSVTPNPEPRLPPPSGGTLNPSIFRQEADYWTIGYQGTVFRLKDARGLHYLSYLLRHPDQEFHVLDLVALGIGSDVGEATQASPLLSARGPRLNDAGTILDPQARAAYKQRLQELREELAEAQHHNDLGRIDRIQQEMEFLTQQLASAVGLGGRPRHAASHIERARVNITKAIKTALKKITESDQALGRYLATTIKTGTFCSYTLDPRFPIAWQF